MRRASLFLVVFLGAAAALIGVTLWYLAAYQENSGSLGGMMGQMSGGYTNGMLKPMPTGVWFGLLGLVTVAVAGVAGYAYYTALPEIASVPEAGPGEVRPKAESDVSWAALIKTSNEEERKVLGVLEAHHGKYLQKFIVKESGLSKLKTHRILSRFAERGVVTAEKSGNTNEISLSPWLLEDHPAH